MLGIFNGTQVVSAVAASDLGIFLTAALTAFGAVIIAYLVMDYFHNKHMENLGKQLVDVATVGIQADQSMLAVAIAAMQGMDITDKILGKPVSQTEKKTQ
jgi:heme/copper-type cytochrome/quinol oxidase subunit 3